MHKDTKQKVNYKINNETLLGYESLHVKYKDKEIVVSDCSSLLLLEPPLSFQFSPIDFDFKKPIIEESKKYKSDLIKLLGKDVLIFDGKILHPNLLDINETAEFFQEILIMFNLIGIPVNLFDSTIFTLFLMFSQYQMTMSIAKEVNKSFLHMPKLVIDKENSIRIIDSINSLYKKIMENTFLTETKIYDLLAKARYSFFHNDFRSSFIHSWLFIEAMISKMWEVHVIKIHGTKKSANDILKNRSWTIYIKIEELFLLNIITKNTKTKIHEMRQKRNNLFHLNTKKEKRRIFLNDAKQCHDIAINLFYYELKMDPPNDFIDFSDIRKLVMSYIKENLLDMNKLLGIPNDFIDDEL